MTPTRPAIRVHRSLADWQIALAFGAVVLGLCNFRFGGGFGFGDGYEMAATARSLAEHGEFANPFAPHMTGPSALAPPLFPFFLALLIKLLRHPAYIVEAAVLTNIAVNALIAGLLPHLSSAFYGDSRPGALAGVLWLFCMPLLPQWDVSFTVAGLIAFCLVAWDTVARRDWKFRASAAGLLAGLVLLLNPAAATVVVLCVGFLFLWRRVGWRYALQCGSVMVLACALPVMPWVARNYRLWHAFLIRSSFGINLFVSNNDCAGSSLFQETRSGCFQATHPTGSESEARLLRSMGEVPYDRLKKSEALAWIASHRRRFAQLTAARFVDFWFPDPVADPFRCYATWAVTLLSLPGIALMVRRREPVTILVLAIWLIYPLVYYIVISCDRYRYPILFTSLLPAGYAVATLAARMRTASVRVPTP